MVTASAQGRTSVLAFEPTRGFRLLGLGRLVFVLWVARVDEQVIVVRGKRHVVDRLPGWSCENQL
jgi:hypothetical protein